MFTFTMALKVEKKKNGLGVLGKTLIFLSQTKHPRKKIKN